MRFIKLFSFITVTFVFNCHSPVENKVFYETLTCSEYPDIAKWTSDKRNEVITHVLSVKPDSVVKDQNEEFNSVSHFKDGEVMMKFTIGKYSVDTVAFEYNYKEFTANGESCPIASHTYRGLKYKDQHIGLATYSDCMDSIKTKGLFYEGERIGTWRRYYMGKVVDSIDYGKGEFIKEIIK